MTAKTIYIPDLMANIVGMKHTRETTGNAAGDYEVSYTVSRNFTDFGPQTAKNKTFTFSQPSVNAVAFTMGDH